MDELFTAAQVCRVKTIFGNLSAYLDDVAIAALRFTTAPGRCWS
jgi:acid stress-induced BolA-like protein IbaG/YrbA